MGSLEAQAQGAGRAQRAADSWIFRWGAGGAVWTGAGGCRVLGIVNVTPDSFSDGGSYATAEDAVRQALALIDEGADALDVGGESTRPGHVPVDPGTEWERLRPVLAALRDRVSVPLSVDTRHASVAERALELGVQAVNDVTGLGDPEMAKIVLRLGASVILGDWQPGSRAEPRAVFGRVLERASDLESRGVPHDRIAVDPGLGFAKKGRDNWRILRELEDLVRAGYPVVLGASRKRFVTTLAGSQDLAVRDEVTAYVSLLAARAGAAMARVHRPGPTRRALAVLAQVMAEDEAQLASDVPVSERTTRETDE